MANKDPKTILIGELLVQADFLAEVDLAEALEIAADTQQKIGRVLVISGFITEEDLVNGLAAQTKMREGTLGLEAGLSLLRLAHDSNITFDAALAQLGGMSFTKLEPVQ